MQRPRNGRSGQRQRIDIDLQLFKPVFHAYAEFLLLVHNQQSQIAEFHILANQLMRADDNVQLAACKPSQNVFLFFSSAQTAQIIDGARHIGQPRFECFVVLHCQYGGRHKHCNLLIISHSFERGTDSNLGLAETNIAAHQAVHRHLTFHIGLDSLRGLHLVGRVLVHKRRLELLVHKRVGREGETFLRLALRVQFDKVFGNVLHLALGRSLEPLPSARAQLVDCGHFGLLAFIFRYAVKRVDAHKKHIVILVYQLDGFLILAIDVDFL